MEPFHAFTKLNSLVIDDCKVRDAQTPQISSETLANLAMRKINFTSTKLSYVLRVFALLVIPTIIFRGEYM